MFSKVLVANRGEIAIRVMRALEELGIASVAVYSEPDRDAPHVRRADEAYLLGPGPANQSYLVVEKIVETAQRAGAEAIHPGYGFLAENAAFARACEKAGIVFVGPPAEAIDAMGSKTRARELMKEAGVPIVPGTTDAVDTVEDAARIVDEAIGYPVAIKAAGGGGGKGFRVALEADELEKAFEGAAREGEKFFSDATVYIERYLPDPRHVEVQVLADSKGNVIHLGERDCSVQRRHQKLIEESPAPAVDEELRERIGRIGTEAARAVGYRSAGTVEGLLADGEYAAAFWRMRWTQRGDFFGVPANGKRLSFRGAQFFKLRDGRIAGAGLDVFDVEPLPLDHPFRKMDNVVLTPHLGYVSAQNYKAYFNGVVEDIRAFLDGKPVRVMTA